MQATTIEKYLTIVFICSAFRSVRPHSRPFGQFLKPDLEHQAIGYSYQTKRPASNFQNVHLSPVLSDEVAATSDLVASSDSTA